MSKKPDRQGFITTEGVPELLRALKEIDPRLTKQIGQRNKAIGQRIIDKAFPKPESVGAGVGAKPKASAVAKVLRIVSGGKHRTKRVQTWGRIPTSRDGVKRPYIRRSAVEDMPQIEKDYMDALLETARSVGIEARRG